MLKMEGEGLASEFHCRGIEERGQTWWVPKHAVDTRYNKIKEHAKQKQPNVLLVLLKNTIIVYH